MLLVYKSTTQSLDISCEQENKEGGPSLDLGGLCKATGVNSISSGYMILLYEH